MKDLLLQRARENETKRNELKRMYCRYANQLTVLIHIESTEVKCKPLKQFEIQLFNVFLLFKIICICHWKHGKLTAQSTQETS